MNSTMVLVASLWVFVSCSASHVVILLATKYPTYKIINYDKLDYCASLKNLEAIADLPNYEFVHGDILATDLVNYVIRKEKVDTIMHFAAQSHVGEPRALVRLEQSVALISLDRDCCHPACASPWSNGWCDSLDDVVAQTTRSATP